MTSRPSLLLLVLNWDDMRTIVHSLWTSIILSFFLSCTAVMLTHLWGQSRVDTVAVEVMHRIGQAVGCKQQLYNVHG
jgi:ABC-type spermidine/putrescine transport system permease subunit II